MDFANLYRTTIIEKSGGSTVTKRITLVGDLKTSFKDEGLVPLELEGRILALYDIETELTLVNTNLLERDKKAVIYMGEAYKVLSKFHDKRKEETTMTEVKCYAATKAMPLEEIKAYADGKGLFSLTAKELADRFNAPIELAQYRLETLRLGDPDININLIKKYDPHSYLDDEEGLGSEEDDIDHDASSDTSEEK